MIDKELMQKWEKEASELYPTPYSGELKLYQLAANQRIFRDREYYIKGRTDQYLQMQAENERLKGLIEIGHNEGWRNCIMRNYISQYESYLSFKTEHNL